MSLSEQIKSALKDDECRVWTKRRDEHMARTMRKLLPLVLIELDALRAQLATRGIVLPGWTCVHCQGFNSAAKEWLKECRGCGEKGPTQP